MDDVPPDVLGPARGGGEWQDGCERQDEDSKSELLDVHISPLAALAIPPPAPLE
jgi:hypothetical protein